jgi:hypothetical protein
MVDLRRDMHVRECSTYRDHRRDENGLLDEVPIQ